MEIATSTPRTRVAARRVLAVGAPVVLALAALATRAHAAPDPATAAPPSNVLILLADDMGVDMLGTYGLGAEVPTTPNLDALRANGVLFTRAWTAPICSPTRGMIQTGRFPFRTGLGANVSAQSSALPQTELTMPEMLDVGTGGLWGHGCFGKWHVADYKLGGGLDGPTDAGWGTFEGTLDNLTPQHGGAGTPYDYYLLPWISGNVQGDVTAYATTYTVDRALEWIGKASEPWLALVNFHAPHDPWHTPPEGLYTVDLSRAGNPSSNPRPYYKAAIEAMDSEIGRLLAGIGPRLDNTLVIFLGDNGSPGAVTVAPFDPSHGKTTMYEGGVQVPLIVSGPQVTAPGSTCDALVCSTDLFATVAQVAGVRTDHLSQFDAQAGPLSFDSFVLYVADLGLTQALSKSYVNDSISLLPYLADPDRASLRSLLYAERFNPNGPGPWGIWRRAVRGPRFKLIRNEFGQDLLFDLQSDPFEQAPMSPGDLSGELVGIYEGLVAGMKAISESD